MGDARRLDRLLVNVMPEVDGSPPPSPVVIAGAGADLCVRGFFAAGRLGETAGPDIDPPRNELRPPPRAACAVIALDSSSAPRTDGGEDGS